MPEPAKKPYPATRQQKKYAHWAKNDLCWDEETYRGFCAKITGKRSTKEMTFAEGGRLIAAFGATYKARGLRPPWQRPKPVKPGRKSNPGLTWEPSWLAVRPADCTASQAQLEIIRDRWLALARRGYCRPDKLQEALDAWLTKRHGIEDGILGLESDQAQGVVKAIMEMEERYR